MHLLKDLAPGKAPGFIDEGLYREPVQQFILFYAVFYVFIFYLLYYLLLFALSLYI